MKRRLLLLVVSFLPLAANGSESKPKTAQFHPASDFDHVELNQAEQDFHRGLQFADGDGVVRDYAEAARQYRKAAEAGYIPAQYNLAYLYENGLGVRLDLARAANWYRRAAVQGDAQAQNNLGALLAIGDGVPLDEGQAVSWYRRSAEQGDLEGMSNLATMLLQGRGVKQDLVEAFDLFRFGAERGHAISQNNLALMYANGQATVRDYVMAFAWLDVAAAAIPTAGELRDRIGGQLTRAQISRAKGLADLQRAKLTAKETK